MLTLVTSFVIPVALVLIFQFLNTRQKPAIFGVYQQQNKYYWLKFTFMYIFLLARQLIGHIKRFEAVEEKSSDGTIHVHEQDAVLEQKYDLGSFPMAVDAVYFNGISKEGIAVVTGIARRPDHCDAFMYLKVADNELLLTPSLPDTSLHQTTEEEGNYSVQGLYMNSFIPMRTWKVNYKGEMKPRNNDTEKVNVEVALTWSAHWPHFNYDTQISPKSMARDMAREQWSSDYFKMLKRVHQTHYEQMGYLKGTVSINGKDQYIRIPCVRDHTFGTQRNWRNFHRYVYHFIFLENGDCMAIGAVSQPTVLSHLTIGYLCLKSDHHEAFPVDSCDFQLYQHAENQIMPKDYGFTFEAGGKSYSVQVQVKDEISFFIGKDREAKLYERWSEVLVNDVKGMACVEWHYNNTAA